MANAVQPARARVEAGGAVQPVLARVEAGVRTVPARVASAVPQRYLEYQCCLSDDVESL